MDSISAMFNHRLLAQYGVRASWVLASILLAAILLHTFTTAKKQQAIKKANYAEQTLAPVVQKTSNYRVQDILSANLLGKPESAIKEVKKAPKTTLQLTLQGILHADDSVLDRAIIANSKKKTGLYSVGEKIDNTNVKVHEIRQDEVLINRSGSIESLPLIKKTSSGNRQIVTFNNPVNEAPVIPTQAPSSASRPTANAVPPPGADNPRKVRKPNFTGLDKALQKMGEL